MSSQAFPPLSSRDLRELAATVERYLRAQLHDRELARDLRQEVMLRVARGHAGFDGRSSLSTWAIAIARHVIADHFRAERRVDDDALAQAQQAQAVDAPPADTPLVAAEMASCIQAEVQRLPPGYREMLELHDLQDLSAREAAEAADCTVATAKIRIHRARAKLRASMERNCRVFHDGSGALVCEKA